jgi:hypothetical protein
VACSGGQSCSAGSCGCPSGQTLCGATCISTQADPANCGYCGTQCQPGETCSSGVCTSTGDAAAGDAGTDSGPAVVPFESLSPYAYLRKVKNLLTGLAPTDQEVLTLTQAAEADRPAVLRTMMSDWINVQHPNLFKEKMVRYFINLFQQTGFNPIEDFKVQLLENGGFDFGPLGIYGDTAFPRLIQSLQESFARTAWEFVAGGQPFTNVLTTQRLMMNTGLKSLYLQIEMPNDEPYNFGGRTTQPTCTTDATCQTGQCRADTQGTLRCLAPIWKVDLSGTVIPLTDTLNPSSANYMVFSDERPVNPASFELQPTCYGTAQIKSYTGYAQMFQRLIGFTPRHPFVAQPDCWEHMSKPVFTDADFSDWQWVNIVKRPAGERYLQPYDLPKVRTATELRLTLPRVGFFSTPAYLAIWNTNDSNQHRVTGNQTLLVALQKSFTSANDVNPTTLFGLDDVHAVEGSTCYSCHKSLDPLRNFWANQYDFRDRNDFPTNTFGGGTPNPRPTTTGGGLAFGNVNSAGTTLVDLGNLIGQITESTSADPTPISRFALAMTQYLCYWADSEYCGERDSTFRGVARGFQTANFDFKTLVLDLLSSPLITAAAHTDTFDERNVMISVSRRRQLCAALSNRLGQTDVCALDVAMPFSSGFDFRGTAYSAQRSTLRIAGSVAADAFSRGSEIPVTPSGPTLFYRAATELLCEDVATRLVDTTGSPFSSSDSQGAMLKMVELIMGYTASDPHHDEALQILKDNFAASGTNATNALRSTFSLACQSPTSLAFGL